MFEASMKFLGIIILSDIEQENLHVVSSYDSGITN